MRHKTSSFYSHGGRTLPLPESSALGKPLNLSQNVAARSSTSQPTAAYVGEDVIPLFPSCPGIQGEVPDAMIGQTISHYRITDKLGEGGMGVVYVAEDTHLGRRVAVKFLSSVDEHHFRARFLREARAVSALSHPHIATIFDYGETAEGHPFIVMELVDGQTLSDLLHQSALTIPRAVEIIADVAEALGEAHARGIIHRDIKPSNVVINRRGQVKVLDFGLAKQLNENQHSQSADPDARTLLATTTQAGVVVGTPLYLSPEQATGAEVDARSDLFALGALLYECITGRPAFAGTSVLEIGAQVIHIDPPLPSEINPRVPRELDRITMKALAKKPEARYQSAEEMWADLNEVRALFSDESRYRTERLSATSRLTQSGARPSLFGTLSALSDSMRRPRLSVIFLIGVLVVAGLLLLGVTRWWRPTPHQPSAEAQRWYDKGADALRDGAYYQASKALERAVIVDDKFALAHARLAEAWTELDYSDKAKDALLRVSSLVPDRSVLPELDALYLDAVSAMVTRDYPKAVASYSQIVQLSPSQPQVYVDLGRAYEKTEESQQAVDAYLEATKRDLQYATAYLRLGILYGRQQNLPSAYATFDKADTLYQALGNVEGRAETFFQRGSLLNNIDKVDEARRYLQQALDIARATDNPYQQIQTLLQLSSALYTAGDTEQALAHAREALNLAQANGMENLTTRGLVDIGNVFLTREDYDEAEKYFRQALEFAQRYRGRRNEARALLSLGSLRIQQNNPDEAVRYIEQALAFYQQGGYRKEVSLGLTLLGRANRMKGDYAAALKDFEQLLQLGKQVGDTSQVASSLNGIGTVLLYLERYPEALSYFAERYALSSSIGDQATSGYSMIQRADALWQLGRYQEARESLAQATAIVRRSSGGNKALTAEINQLDGEIALSERRFPEAIAQSEQALSLAGTQYKATAVQARRVLGLARLNSGAKQAGKSSCQEALEMAKQMGNPWLVSKTQLALAEALLENGEMEAALATISQAQESFTRSGQTESAWRAWLLAARATRRNGDQAKAQEQAARAADLLSQLQQKWGDENYRTYLARPDIQNLRKQLSEEFALSR